MNENHSLILWVLRSVPKEIDTLLSQPLQHLSLNAIGKVFWLIVVENVHWKFSNSLIMQLRQLFNIFLSDGWWWGIEKGELWTCIRTVPFIQGKGGEGVWLISNGVVTYSTQKDNNIIIFHCSILWISKNSNWNCNMKVFLVCSVLIWETCCSICKTWQGCRYPRSSQTGKNALICILIYG